MTSTATTMMCPVCRTVALTMTSREGVEIDYCPQCRGVWLDRGELDKLIERNAQFGASGGKPAPAHQSAPPTQHPHQPAAQPPPGYPPQQGYGYAQPGYPPQQGYQGQPYPPRYDDDDDDDDRYRRRRRRGFLGELFDFD